ncbi:FAD-binding protein [Xanthobacter autotrophicus]|uniref:FAD-binding protein n=1 Tax=Xanthobacter autotrophicus TaxID=280 RepID=UPI001E5BA9C5|nr:FAD-binding protein [Xanthobacter autotrophicus]UDQ87837.1 FAD-binding protein [Xanthobacter autotrophicus]
MAVAIDVVQLETDVLVIGSGAAGMMAALEAGKEGAGVILADRSLIGRSGATIMAQMTVAVALGSQTPDGCEHHLADTLAAGRELCDASLAQLVCEEGPRDILQLDEWKVGWARNDDGSIRQALAPGHDRPRCVYVDFLSTGPAVAKTLRGRVLRQKEVTRIGDLYITDILVTGGVATGATGFSLADGRPVVLKAKAVVIATGGLTRLYQRNSASANMSGDGYALALRAGAELTDMEFVQFFPIGHLAPRLVGMDPIMWDPFRYKLGGRLLNADMREFVNDYGNEEAGTYNVTRDRATFAILSEVKAGRGSPAGGAYLSFQHIPAETLRASFGPVIDRLAANGIDLTRMPIEVAPIAHYHMGGVKVDAQMRTSVPGLFSCGEANGGSNGANRLSGNAITEAFVFGRTAGRTAALHASTAGNADTPVPAGALDLVCAAMPEGVENHAGLIADLQQIMAVDVGPFRTEQGLQKALAAIAGLKAQVGALPPGAPGPYNMARLDWFDLRTMLLVAEAVTRSALARKESRGAHQRDDFPAMDPAFVLHHTVKLAGDDIVLGRAPVEGRTLCEIA